MIAALAPIAVVAAAGEFLPAAMVALVTGAGAVVAAARRMDRRKL